MKTLLLILLLALIYAVVANPTPKAIPPVIRIAIIDTGYDVEFAKANNLTPLKLCAFGHYDYRSRNEYVGHSRTHGTLVASALAKELIDVNYCAIIYQVDSTDGVLFTNLSDALDRAVANNVAFINYSLTGAEPDPNERRALVGTLTSGIEVFAAAGNEGRDLSKNCMSYPACYGLSNVISVGALSLNKRAKYSNYGKYINTYYPGNLITTYIRDAGTSFAAPRALAARIKQSLTLTKGKK